MMPNIGERNAGFFLSKILPCPADVIRVIMGRGDKGYAKTAIRY